MRKRAYKAPRLTRLGNLCDLTAGGAPLPYGRQS